MRGKLIALLCMSFGLIGYAAGRHVWAQQTPADYAQEVGQLLADANRADISDTEAEARRQRARELAAKYAATVAAHHPSGEDRVWLGYLYHLAGDTEKAIETFRQVLEDKSLIEEFKQQARLYLIRTLSEAGRVGEAESILAEIPSTAFNADEARAQGHEYLAIAYTKRGELDKAVEHEKQALEAAQKSGLIPRIWMTGRSLAQLYVAVGRPEEAAKLLDELKAYFDRQARLAGPRPPKAIQTAIGQIETAIAQLKMIGRPAPPLNVVKWIKETPTTLDALRGKVVALEFFAAWCPDCRGLIPHLRDWHARYTPKGLKILAVTRYYGYNGREVGKASPAEEEAFLARFKQLHSLPYGTAIDNDQQSMTTYHVRSIPHVVIIDRSGRVRFVFTWHTNPSLCEYMIKRVLAESAEN